MNPILPDKYIILLVFGKCHHATLMAYVSEVCKKLDKKETLY